MHPGRRRCSSGEYRAVCALLAPCRPGASTPIPGDIISISLLNRPPAAAVFQPVSIEPSRSPGAPSEREAFLQAVLENVPDGLITFRPDGTIESFNAGAERIFGIRASDAVGGDIRRWLDVAYENLLGKGPLDTLGRRADGASFPMSVAVNEMKIGGQTLLVTSVRDVTEKKDLERRLQLSQRMESIGTLAGGVAHDFNNLLTGILTYATMGISSVDADHPLRADLTEIARQANRGASLVRQLLAFSRKQILEPRHINLNEIVAEMEKFLRRVIGEQIEVEVALAPDLKTVYADPAQVEQVLLNLCVNARDAMPAGGRLRLQTTNLRLDQDATLARVSLPPSSPPGEYVRVSVADTGTGIDTGTLQRIFEPFFTTKEAGKGTGLGLAVVYGIVKQHEGFIDVESEPAKGTAFGVHFPAVNARAIKITRAPSAEPRGGAETILLAEDDEAVRKATLRVLKSFGYTVLWAANGEEALRVFAENADRIDLVILDVVMPRKGGREVYTALKDRKPGLKFLFVSGYSADDLDRTLLLNAGLAFLQKPFQPDELARRVRESLDRRGA